MNNNIKENYLKVSYRDKPSSYPTRLADELFYERTRGAGVKVLDLGCGNGAITKEIQNMGGYEVDGADMCDDAKNVVGEDHFFEVDFKSTLPMPSNHYNIVFCKSVIEHLHDPDILFYEVHRILKHGGTFICMTPSWKHSYKEQFYIEHTHVTPFTRLSLRTIGEFHGFDVKKCEYFYQLPFLWRHKYLLPFIKIVGKLGIPYRPFYNVPWTDGLNKFFRFSTEAMLLAEFKKPYT